MKNCVVYLGGSITQSSNFNFFKKKKIITILVDQNKRCHCKKYADIFVNNSHTEINIIINKIKKILLEKNLKIIDCFGVAHYSYPAVNAIKKKFIPKYKLDYFLLYKHIQKQKLFNYKISPRFLKMPSKLIFSKNKNFYMNKIYKFAHRYNFKIFIKPSSTHQGIGITEIKKKENKINFKKKYYSKILKTYNFCKYIFIEQKVEGRLLNLDIIKNERNEFIFLPIIYRDKVIFKDKRKYLSVFQYTNNENVLKKDHYEKLKSILINNFPNKKIFATLDCLIHNDNLNILELSPHFHNSKLLEFLNNKFILDLYFKKKFSNSLLKKIKKTKLGGYIFLLNNHKENKKIINFVKLATSKILIDNIDIKTRKKFFKKHAFVKKNFIIIYFKCKNNNNLKAISKYVEDNKEKIYK